MRGISFLVLEKLDNELGFKARMFISSNLKEDFRWWLNTLADQDQTNLILMGRFAWEIFSDVSWARMCHPDFDLRRKRPSISIHALELKAVLYALKCFASDLSNCEILLKVDNITAMSYNILTVGQVSPCVDTFTLDWSEFYFYAFPPFILLLRKIIDDEAEGAVIVP